MMSKKVNFPEKPGKFAKSRSSQNLNVNIRPQPNNKKRAASIGGIEELVQCGICLDKLNDPRMLPCQHTYCLSCLKAFVQAKYPVCVTPMNFNCALCQEDVVLPDGIVSLDNLPKNLNVVTILKLLEDDASSPLSPKPLEGIRCSKCQTVFEGGFEKYCQHCKLTFCNICWNQHIVELEDNLKILEKQLDESRNRLNHKAENVGSRCDKLMENINEEADERIQNIIDIKNDTLGLVDCIKTESKVTYNRISDNVLELKKKLSSGSLGKDNKVENFIDLHKETSTLIRTINHYGEARIYFDSKTFKVEQDTEGIYNDEEINNDPITNIDSTNISLDSQTEMSLYYKTKSFKPKIKWNIYLRLGSIGIPPWDSNLIYITGTDSHAVIVMNKEKKKTEGRLTNEAMLYPVSVTFSTSRKEIYVSDRWNHSIHVFSHDGVYLRKLGGKGKLRNPNGIDMTPRDKLVIADSGNDRIVVMNPIDDDDIFIIGLNNKGKLILNMPMDVAVFGNDVVVADTGNHRIKTFRLDGKKTQEFGICGRHKGQFRSAEVVAVDSLGFILVGDAGNARIQVFTPDGTLVKVFGDKEGFQWISGLLVTPEKEILVTDCKRRSLVVL